LIEARQPVISPAALRRLKIRIVGPPGGAEVLTPPILNIKRTATHDHENVNNLKNPRKAL
jgi:hypothetical protein